jgi:cysteine-rich CPCC protein
MSGVDDLYPCPCCGYLMFSEPAGSYEICSICFWEDDAVQLRWPDWAGGANSPSLRESQRNFVRFGAMEERFVRNVRKPEATDRVDEGWRPIDLERDHFEPRGDQQRPWPDDRTVLYWWRSTFWKHQ